MSKADKFQNRMSGSAHMLFLFAKCFWEFFLNWNECNVNVQCVVVPSIKLAASG